MVGALRVHPHEHCAVRDGIGEASGVRWATAADKLPLLWNGHYLIEVDEGGAATPGGAEISFDIRGSRLNAREPFSRSPTSDCAPGASPKTP